MGGLGGIKHPTSIRMLATIASVKGFSWHPVVRHCRWGYGRCKGTADEAVGSTRGGHGSREVHFIKQTLWTYPVSTHALIEEGKSNAYISGEAAIGDGALAGGCEDGGSLADCKLLGWGFFFLFFFFFFFLVCCCCCEELEVSIVDCCVKMGIGSLNGRGLLMGESSVIVDTFKSPIPDLQRLGPQISEQWRWP